MTAVLLLGMYPGKWKYIYRKPYIWMFMAALLIIAKKWKQPKSTTGEQRNKITINPYDRILSNNKNEVLISPTSVGLPIL